MRVGLKQVGRVLGTLVIFTLLYLWASGASAQDRMVAEDGTGNMATLYLTRKCALAAAEAIARDIGEWRVAEVLYNGRTYQACWTARPPNVYLIYEDGDTGVVAMQMFQPRTGI